MDVQKPEPIKGFAVIQTGGITATGDIIIFKDEKGNKRPATVGVYADEEKATRMRRLVSARATRIVKFADDSLHLLQPIYGVVEVTLPAVSKRGPRKKSESANGHSDAKVGVVPQPTAHRAAGKPVGAK